MTLRERLRQLASALPSDDCAVTITRADLVMLLDDDTREARVGSTQDLTVRAVAKETGRAPSTNRDWLISGALCGYKLNGRDWRVSRDSLRNYLHAQSTQATETEGAVGKVDITKARRRKAQLSLSSDTSTLSSRRKQKVPLSRMNLKRVIHKM